MRQGFVYRLPSGRRRRAGKPQNGHVIARIIGKFRLS